MLASTSATSKQEFIEVLLLWLLSCYVIVVYTQDTDRAEVWRWLSVRESFVSIGEHSASSSKHMSCQSTSQLADRGVEIVT